MKKLLSLLLMLALITSLLVVSASAADTKVYRTYAEAKNGDLLWIVDFNAKDVLYAQPNDNAKANMTYTIGDDGRSVTVKGVAGATDKKTNFWGGPIKGLEVTDKDTATMTFKVKANGKNGTNNSTGIGGWLYDSTDPTAYNTQSLNNYSNWNSVNTDGTNMQNRACLSVAQSKKANGGSYLYEVDKAVADADGFITVKLEFNGPEVEYTTAYLGEGGKWIEDPENIFFMEKIDDKADSLCFMIYSYYLAVDTTVKDVKYFKGIKLTDAQLNAEAPAAATTVLETTAAPVTTVNPTTTAAPVQTPATADATLVIAAAGAMALALLTSRRRAR